MKRFLWSYISSFLLLAIVFFWHYVELLKGVLGDIYGEVLWKGEALYAGFIVPLIPLFILQSIMYFSGYLLIYYLLKKRGGSNRMMLIGLVLFSWLGGALFLGLFEPILATDYFEYGTRQELNRIFELFGYTRINVTVYLYLTLTALLTWFFVKEKANKSAVKVADHVDHGELLDH
ncbi:hypothetical protein [Parvicella tangerina]|uniref:Uncharacterized protein n=1 Tax=Parvicella tangerina TaxID=2829795 RepID=A0A916JPT9_9FLAO|nr:hypothetical protein [Parvicella tangerina]CAG5085155.1 hypothetical protein CRYO30217_02663 [Parvicella tangerina]